METFGLRQLCALLAAAFTTLLMIGNIEAKTDLTLTPKASGSAVVRAAIQKVQDTCIFGNDYQFLRRIAWVESKFGADTSAFNDKMPVGIWKMTQQQFTATQDANNFSPGSQWQNIVDGIKAQLGGISYEGLSFDQMALFTPLYATLAERFYWEYVTKGKPLPITVKGQAKLWRSSYTQSANASETTFINSVNTIPAVCRSSGADVLFMMDASGSITGKNWVIMTKFVADLVKKFTFGAESYRFAVDQFSTDSKSVISFDAASTGDELAALVQKIKYTGGGTRTDLALYHAIQYSFTAANGARPVSAGYPRVIVVITDGESNEPAYTVAAQTAAKQNGLVLFTVGIGNAFINEPAVVELRTIASQPKCLHMFLLQDFNALSQSFPEELRAQTCRANAVLNDVNVTQVNGAVSQGQYKLFEFQADLTTGVRFTVDMASGATEMYIAQSVRSPDEVIYDYKISASVGSNGDIVIEKNQLMPINNTDNQLMSRMMMNETKTAPIYASLKGVDDTNTFKLNIYTGDKFSRPSKSAAVLSDTRLLVFVCSVVFCLNTIFR